MRSLLLLIVVLSFPALAAEVYPTKPVRAGGIVGTEIVARAAPDGYSFLVGTAGGMSINPALQSKLPYDPFRRSCFS